MNTDPIIVVSCSDKKERTILSNLISNHLNGVGFRNVEVMDSDLDDIATNTTSSLLDMIRHRNPRFFSKPITVMATPDPAYISKCAMDSNEVAPNIDPPWREDSQTGSEKLRDEFIPNQVRSYGKPETVPFVSDKPLFTGAVAEPDQVVTRRSIMLYHAPGRELEARVKAEEYRTEFPYLKFNLMPQVEVTPARLHLENESARGEQIEKYIGEPINIEAFDNPCGIKYENGRLSAEQFQETKKSLNPPTDRSNYKNGKISYETPYEQTNDPAHNHRAYLARGIREAEPTSDHHAAERANMQRSVY
jgi:hypothetical protein